LDSKVSSMSKNKLLAKSGALFILFSTFLCRLNCAAHWEKDLSLQRAKCLANFTQVICCMHNDCERRTNRIFVIPVLCIVEQLIKSRIGLSEFVLKSFPIVRRDFFHSAPDLTPIHLAYFLLQEIFFQQFEIKDHMCDLCSQ